MSEGTGTGPSETRYLGDGPHDLMAWRAREVLLVSSLYDSYLMEQDGPLAEGLDVEYRQLNLFAPPRITRVSTGEEALEAIRTRPVDLVVTMSRVGAMEVREFARALRRERPDLPIVVLAHSAPEAERLKAAGIRALVDRVFVWHGDVRIILAIVKTFEDARNAAHDVLVAGARVIVVVEDSERELSAFLPMLYAELMGQHQVLLADGVNERQRLRRMRMRPKILLAESFEEGVDLLKAYPGRILAVVTDARFPRDGRLDPDAGLEFVRRVKAEDPDIHVLLQSSEDDVAEAAIAAGAAFLHKRSPRLLEDLRGFIHTNLGFGEFVFRMPDGTEVRRVRDLHEMSRALREVPVESIRYHSNRNHFSTWCLARTEFAMAERLKPVQVSQFTDLEEMRAYLIEAFEGVRRAARTGEVSEFQREEAGEWTGFARIGGGSLGGKGRGLGFANALLSRGRGLPSLPDLRVAVPATVVVATDVFADFLADNDLLGVALSDSSDAEIAATFGQGTFRPEVEADLRALVTRTSEPLAVRSSSLFEDSHDRPFAGVYLTFMLGNSDPDPEVRFRRLCDAVRRVYASTYFKEAKAYLHSTDHRPEEERMAVIVQRLVGRTHAGRWFYPDFAGVARSHNSYPVLGTKPEDGVAVVAMGLGKTVVDGGRAVRFCPRQPGVLPQFSSVNDTLEHAQRTFYALDLAGADRAEAGAEGALVRLDLDEAASHGTLGPVASTYNADDDVIRDGTYGRGVRLGTFSPILKGGMFPLPEVLVDMLGLGSRALSCPVEIEFAVNLKPADGGPAEFAFLQVRPMTLDTSAADIDELDTAVGADRVLCRSKQALGQGREGGICDVVYVKPASMDRGRSHDIASEVEVVNRRLLGEGRPYLLIGPGRWGTSDPWLGIPTTWAQISRVRAIVETDLADVHVEPSEGTHFFQNITAAGIAYVQVDRAGGDWLDQAWLDGQPAAWEGTFVRHVRVDSGLEVHVDGRSRRGLVVRGG